MSHLKCGISIIGNTKMMLNLNKNSWSQKENLSSNCFCILLAFYPG